MAHKGRVFPFLFARDFARWGNEAGLSLPEKVKTTTGGGLGTDIIGWTFKTIKSTEGVYDYETGKVLYTFVPPPTAPPGTSLKIEYFLTFDALQWNARALFVGGSGTQRVQMCNKTFATVNDMVFSGAWIPTTGLPVFFGFGVGNVVPEPWPP